MPQYTIRVDGRAHTIEADADIPLLYALRDDLALPNPHFGCGLSQCGACMVIINGRATKSCSTPISEAAGQQVTTLNGLGTPDKPHPVQKAFLEEQVPQCGYCISGWVMTAAAFLETKKNPTDAEIKQALAGVKCRCGTHTAIMRAVKRAADSMA